MCVCVAVRCASLLVVLLVCIVCMCASLVLAVALCVDGSAVGGVVVGCRCVGVRCCWWCGWCVCVLWLGVHC